MEHGRPPASVERICERVGLARTGLLEWEEVDETDANSDKRLAGRLGDRHRRRSASGGQICRRRLQYADRQRLARGDDLLDQGRGAEASGKVSKVVVANRNGGPSEQIADIRNLISAGANIIIINPSDREALNPVIKQAADKGIVVVAVDQAVSAPEAYVLTNDQVEYAKLGAKWLFDKLGGKGSVVEMRGIDGVPADADRHEGFTEVLKNYPEHQSHVGVHRLGARQDRAGDQGPPRLRQADRRHLDLGHRFDGRRPLTRPPASRSCRWSAPTTMASSASSSI